MESWSAEASAFHVWAGGGAAPELRVRARSLHAWPRGDSGPRLGAGPSAGLPGLAQLPGNWTRIPLRLGCFWESTQAEGPRAED